MLEALIGAIVGALASVGAVLYQLAKTERQARLERRLRNVEQVIETSVLLRGVLYRHGRRVFERAPEVDGADYRPAQSEFRAACRLLALHAPTAGTELSALLNAHKTLRDLSDNGFDRRSDSWLRQNEACEAALTSLSVAVLGGEPMAS